MVKKSKVRKVDFQAEREEKAEYFLKMTPGDRIKYLYKLRRLNLGPMAESPMKKTVTIISRGKGIKK